MMLGIGAVAGSVLRNFLPIVVFHLSFSQRKQKKKREAKKGNHGN